MGFNRDDDPNEVTDRFCALYSIPADMRQQIYDFVAPKVDMAAVAARQSAMQASAAAAIKLHQVPSWATGGFEMYGTANFAAMEKKIMETNAMLNEQNVRVAAQRLAACPPPKFGLAHRSFFSSLAFSSLV